MKWAIVTMAVLWVAWQFELGLLVYASYVMAGLWAMGRLLPAAWTRQLTAERSITTRNAQIGEKMHTTVMVRNDGRWRIPWLLLEDYVPLFDLNAHPPRLKRQGTTLALASLHPGQTQTLSCTIEFLRRGYYQFGPLLAESGDLFGMYRTYRILAEPQFVLVYPKVLPLAGYDIESPRPIGEIRLAHRLFEDPTRISGVRSFQQGDPINRIHWRATARTGMLQSKTFESTSVAGATIVLDFHTAAYAPQARYYCSELAITLAGTVAQALVQMGQQVGFVSNGRDAVERMKFEGWDLTFKTRALARKGLERQNENRRLAPVVVETRRDPGQFDRIQETLARLEFTEEFTFSAMLTEAGPQLPRSATVLAIVSQITPELAAALGSLLRRGYSVLALVLTYGEAEHPDWAAPAEWAERLLQEGVAFRPIRDEEGVSAFCEESLV